MEYQIAYLDIYGNAGILAEEISGILHGAELVNLSAQSRELCSAYVKEKRDGYIQVSFAAPAVLDSTLKALLLTALFAAALGGNAVLAPFYQEYRNSRPGGRKGKREEILREEAPA